MKQISRLLMGGAILCGLWSCSSDNTPDQPGNQPGEFNGTSYIGLQLKMPETSATRANDNYDDGTANEYAVSNCALVLFTGSTEAKATVKYFTPLITAFQTNRPSGSYPNADNITSSDFQIVDVTDMNFTSTSEGNLYGLILINYDATKVSYAAATGETSKTLIVYGQKITNLASLMATGVDDAFVKEENGKYTNFFMTNAPLANTNSNALTETLGNDFKVFTLAQLDKSAIKDTREEAERNPAGCIYVERAVAKVTARQDASFTVSLKDGNAENTPALSGLTASIKWTLDNTEATSYIVRNVGTALTGTTDWAWNLASTQTNPSPIANNLYRMVGNVSMGTLYDPWHTTETAVGLYSPLAYRTYWCIDPSYVNDKAFNDIASDPSKFVDLTGPLYCHENTFPVEKQQYKNTTRVVLEVTLSKDGPTDLYTLNGDKENIFTSIDNVISRADAYICALPEVKTAMEKAAKEGVDVTSVSIPKYTKLTYTVGTDKKLTFDGFVLDEDVDGFDDYFTKTTSNDAFQSALTNLNDIIKFVNRTNVIYKYEGGKSYYAIYIQHFGKDGCPLPQVDGEDVINGQDVESVYGSTSNHTTATKNYLGRYGMVRNNWYDLVISKIVGLGEPVVPDGTLEWSDDNKEQKKYIAVDIHTMSWAKRTNSYELGKQ